MTDILKSDNNVPERYVDMNDGTFARKVSTTAVGSNGVEAGVTPYGYQRVTTEPTSLFNESFDSLDTTNRWTTKTATGTATITNGVLVINSSTTAAAYGGLSTQPTFLPLGLNFVLLGLTLTIPAWIQANTKRFWGFGSVPATPTTSAPVTNGAGFEIDDAGNFFAVIYESSVRTQAININSKKVPDNTPLISGISRRADRIDFYINDIVIPAATILIPTLDVSTLPVYIIAVNSATAPSAAATIQVSALGVCDSGQNSSSIKDPTNPFWQAAVTKPSTAITSSQSALAVAIHPTSLINGQSAHDAVVTGAPLRVGGRAQTAAYTSVASGDTADLMTTTQGVLTVRQNTIPELEWSYAAAAGGVTNTTDVAIAAAAGTSLRRYATGLSLSNNSATATEVVLKDGTTTVLWRALIPANAPNFSVIFSSPIRTTANTALNFACITAGAAIYINAQGYTAP